MISDYYNTFKDPTKDDSFFKKAGDLATQYNPVSVINQAAKYDTSKIADFANQLKEQAGVGASAAAAMRKDLARTMADENEKADVDNEIDKLKINSKSSSSNILAMIFKIVPIGLNIIGRLPVLAKGTGEVIQGTTQGIVGLGMTSFQLFMDTYKFMYQWFIFTFIAIMCSFENLSQLNKCFLFYIIDIILLSIFVLIMSFLFLCDVIFFFVKKMIGIGFVDIFLMVLDILESIDQMVYGLLGLHIFHYPDAIIRMCYSCSLKYNTPALKSTFGKLKYDLGTLLPRRVGPPFSKLSSGGTKIMSVFKM